jgi:predicted transglutaminase-like cysteine proteinase
MLALPALGTASAAGMKVGGYTSQPIGHYEFCQRNPDECRIRSEDPGPLRISQPLWRLIVEVNVAVNDMIRPMNDMEIYGTDEYWSYPLDVGDCEDYVLEKRRQLNAAGIPLADLLITVVRKADGEGHAVLTVRTDRGDFVLDNLTDRVKPWKETDYWYLKRQASNHTGRWVTIDGLNNPFVGSVD